VLFKIFSKILVNKFIHVVSFVVNASQTAFIKGRHIMEGVAVLHEVLHEMHITKSSGILFKIDYEKAFDKVKWHFLLKVLELKGFPHIFNDCIMKIVTTGKVAIKVNDEVGPYFNTFQGLRQVTSFRLYSLIQQRMSCLFL
jgi:hypothetical protein